MAKAIAFFSGIDSFCRTHEVAFRDDGVPFHREYRFNGYAVAPTRWRKMKTDEYNRGDSLNEACQRGSFSWGFKNLTGGRLDELRVRLPDQ